MKKLILIFLLISGACFSQVTQSEAEDIAKSYFEKNYVQNNFKDPYSYELKKLWSEPLTKESSINNKILVMQSLIDNRSFSKKERKQFAEKLNERKIEISKLSPEEKKAIVAYIVFLDTYGANSLGNKILGQYVMTIDRSGKVSGEIVNRD